MVIVFLLLFLLSGTTNAQNEVRHKAGDYKENYDQNYQTNSLSLDYREQQKKPANLLENIQNLPLGLPAIPIPSNNPITKNKVDLGKKLFFDRRLSLNNTISCAICHIPEQGFSNNELSVAIGIEGRSMRRNAPTIYNVAYVPKLFHDAREDSLELQIWGPMLASNEMGNPSFSNVINKIKSFKDYNGLFEKAFNGRQASIVTIGQALANYQRLLVSANSNFDQWYYQKNTQALDKKAKLGFRLFVGKANCIACHTIKQEYALFTDHKLHNTGIGYQSSMSPEQTEVKVQISPGVYVDVDYEIIRQVEEKVKNDLGLYEITQKPKDRWKYKTPSLRNVALTAPYMHNGSLFNLKEVVNFYNQGGVKNPLLSPLIRPLNLSNYEVEALVSFLKNLTGSNVNRLIEDAFSVPVGEVQ